MFGQRFCVLHHFLFVVYPVERCVDGLVEAAFAFLAPVTLYAEAVPVLAEGMAAAFGAAEAGIVGSGSK